MSQLYDTRRAVLLERLQLEDAALDTFIADSLKYFTDLQQKALQGFFGFTTRECQGYAEIARTCGVSTSCAHGACRTTVLFLEELRREQLLPVPADVLQQTVGQFCSIARTYAAFGSIVEWRAIKRLVRITNEQCGAVRNQRHRSEVLMAELLVRFRRDELKVKLGSESRNMFRLEQLLTNAKLRLRD